MGRGAVVVAALAVVAVISVSAAATAIHQLAAPPPSITQFGYVRAVPKAGSAYRLRFDPALWLSGETATRAAREDGAIGPGEPVPNDYYIRNDSRRPLTYRLASNAHLTVVTNAGTGPQSTRISVPELAAIARGRNPNGRKLFGRSLGYWARIVGDRVVRLDQQYQP